MMGAWERGRSRRLIRRNTSRGGGRGESVVERCQWKTLPQREFEIGRVIHRESVRPGEMQRVLPCTTCRVVIQGDRKGRKQP